MRIKRIRLAAYGPFTDMRIDLPATGSDFHILFGPNEAGKSTALKALRHMLFGIPVQTGLNFLHGYTKLRVGARLANTNGDEIEFLRRKGRAKTLRGRDDETVLDDDALAPYLGGVSAEVFEQMFAIGHEELIKGGEEILSGKGSVGQALFAAGAGLIRLQTVQNRLEEECGALFKPSGSTPSINRTAKAIRAARKNQKEALLLPKTWQAHDRDLRDAQKRLENVKKTLGSHKQKQARLERIQEALPLIAEKRDIDARLIAYQGVPALDDDFGEKRRDAEKELKIAVTVDGRSRVAIEKISREIDALPIPRALLENALAIESLQHELGSFRKAQKDRPGLDGRMRQLQKQAADLLEEIGEEIRGRSIDELKLPPSTVGEIQTLGKAYERLTAKQESAREQYRILKNRFNQTTAQRQAMPVPVDVSLIETALQSAQEAGPIETQLAEKRMGVEVLESELIRSLKRQRFWTGSLEAVDTLPLPPRETVDQFETRFDAFQRAVEKHRETRASLKNQIAQTQTELQAIDLSRNVPTESDLNASRTLRDQGWTLIRQELEGAASSADEARAFVRQFDNASGLPDSFEKSMVRADHISDRLRREADQVSRKGLLEARKKELDASLSDMDATLEKALGGRRELEASWQQVWEPSGITPQTPREMRGWLAEMASLREKLVDLRSQKARIETLAAQAAALKSDLLLALDAAGMPCEAKHPLSRLARAAQATINAQRALASDMAAADKDLINLKTELDACASSISGLEGALSDWNTSWGKNLNRLGISPDASPSAALAVIDSIREARNKINDADILRKRIAGIDRDAAEFIDRVDKLVKILAPDLISETRDRAAERLNGRLNKARRDESKQAGLKEQLAFAKKEQEDADRRMLACKALIETLCREANCTTAEALAETEKRAQERQALTRQKSDLEKQLRRLSAGAPVDGFIAETTSVDADSIAPQLQALDEAMDELEKERSVLDQNIGALKLELRQMDGTSAAALHAENAERLLAGLEADVEKYARLKIASIILSRTVEQYREKHQGPLISRASELFARMTLGAFSRLRADYDDNGNPVLVGIRTETDAPVHVDGMSDGTADQLYLALRLASLEQYLENNEPLPFVVDDILMRFDDDRALATLGVLAGLTDKTQVLFFTHHWHLVELAENAGAPHLDFTLHRLRSLT
jgi:uncharacterized protein YhaN